MKVAFQPRQHLETAGNICRLGFDLLHTNTIRPRGGDPALHAFAGGGPNAIEVEAG